MKESVCVLKDLIGLTLNHCPLEEIYVNCKCNWPMSDDSKSFKLTNTQTLGGLYQKESQNL